MQPNVSEVLLESGVHLPDNTQNETINSTYNPSLQNLSAGWSLTEILCQYLPFSYLLCGLNLRLYFLSSYSAHKTFFLDQCISNLVQWTSRRQTVIYCLLKQVKLTEKWVEYIWQSLACFKLSKRSFSCLSGGPLLPRQPEQQRPVRHQKNYLGRVNKAMASNILILKLIEYSIFLW